ncbi:hypothetical protein [Streptomyces sp. NPDC093149]|uniref:hypothetical protein n=1 Tax=Streptomyces sp. NPDC093149 TaxID=3366031 RepID=UPI0037F6CBE8
MVFHAFAAPAEFIRELIVQGTSDGLDAARARGARLGRPPTTTLLSRPQDGAGLSERSRGSRISPLTCCETLAQRL